MLQMAEPSLQCPLPFKNIIIARPMSVVPATQEAEIEGSLEPMSLKPFGQLTTVKERKGGTEKGKAEEEAVIMFVFRTPSSVVRTQPRVLCTSDTCSTTGLCSQHLPSFTDSICGPVGLRLLGSIDPPSQPGQQL